MNEQKKSGAPSTKGQVYVAKPNESKATDVIGTLLGILVVVLMLVFVMRGCGSSSSGSYSGSGCAWCNGTGRYATGNGYETKPCTHCGGTGGSKSSSSRNDRAADAYRDGQELLDDFNGG